MTGLFITAGLVVARVAILIDKTFSPAVARAPASAPQIDYEDSDDFDNDGLSNADETFWESDPYNFDTDGDGFLDGEEVFSGHNPIEATDDSLAKIKEFLSMTSTERVAYLVTGGLLSGDLKDPAQLADAIDSIATSTIYSTLAALEDVQVSDEIKNITDDSKESQEKYTNRLSEIISENIIDTIYKQPRELALLFSPNQQDDYEYYDPQQAERIKSAYLKYAAKFQTAFDSLETADVPKSWTETHKKTLTLLKKVELYHRSIALSADDPLKQMTVLGNLQNVYFEAEPILAEINKKIKASGLSVSNGGFFDISALLNF